MALLRRSSVTLALIWLTAFNLRSVIFGVPPVLPSIRADLGLSFALAGSITSVFLLTLAVGSIPGALLAGRFPARRMVSVASLALAVFAVSRVLPPGWFWVFSGTALLTVAVAFAQPAMAVLIRRWFPDGVTRASNLYGNGLLLGNVGGSSVTPFLAQVFGWRGSFLVWGLCALAGALLWARFAPTDAATPPSIPMAAALRDPRAWQIAALFVFQNLAYFTVATWIPFLVKDQGALSASIVFLCLNCFPILPLLALPFLRWNYPLSTTFYVLAGLLTTAGAAGMMLGHGNLAWALALMVGLGCGGAFVAVVTLPPLLAKDEGEAAGLTAVVFAFGYLFSFAGPLFAGVLVDRIGGIGSAFAPAVVSGFLMMVIGLLAPRRLRRAQAGPAIERMRK
jgi:MFS transporter, CP family, cyanate transporter